MRGKSEGSIYQRKSDNRWVGSIELAPRPGVVRPRKVVTARTKKELLEKFAAAKRAAEQNGSMPTASETVKQWLTYWLDNLAVDSVRPKTMGNYRYMVVKHIIPAIGNVRMDKVTPLTIKHVTDVMVDKGATTVGVHESDRAPDYAVGFQDRERVRAYCGEPAKDAKAPRIPKPKLEALNVEEATRLIAQFGASPESFLWVTFMLTGARRGEILGLEWDRVTDVLDLGWQLQRHPANMKAPADYEYRQLTEGLYLTRPKTKKAERVVPLVPPLSDILSRWRDLAPTNPYNLVFVTAQGQPIDPDYASKQWPKILLAAGITKKVRIHDLRHGAIDLLYEAGVHETTIQEIVGHTNRTMTQAYKSSGNRPQLTDAMKRMSALLGIES